MDYLEYVDLQKNDFYSLESNKKRWVNGQARFINKYFKDKDRELKILDIACGDGVGLREFKKLGFISVVGVEFNEKKTVLARKIGYNVYEYDMHNLSNIKDQTFDIIYSSHTLEHAFNPKVVIREFKRILKKGGELIIILPYVDNNSFNIKAHPAKIELGLNLYDDGKKLLTFFEQEEFNLLKKEYDSYREPEIWLTLTI